MTPGAAAKIISSTFTTAWGTTTTIAHPNVPFTPPATANWVKLDFIWGDGAVTTKDGLNTIAGIMQIAVFGPKDKGDGALYTLAETARDIVNRVRLASPNQDVMFSAVSAPRPLYEESWRSLVITAPFMVMETVT